MKVNTRIFGEVEIEDDKIINFVNGIVGFPDLKHFALIHDEEKGSQAAIRWMQSIEEPSFAMPVMDPLLIKATYNPEVEDELLKPLGDFEMDDLLVLVTVTVPKQIEDITVNLQAPLIINAASRKAAQIIVDGDDYLVKYPIYDILKANKDKAEKENNTKAGE